MKQKGLCNTCGYDTMCAFPRRFPVWQCEEFSIDTLTPSKPKKKKKHGKK